MMRIFFIWLFLIFQIVPGVPVKAQYAFLIKAPSPERLKVLWQHCTYNLISDKDSASTCQFLDGVIHIADSLNDAGLKKYATYFRMCSRLLFSINYRQYFAPGDYKTPIDILQKTRAWAKKNGYADIAAACEHNIGQVYHSEGRFGPAFEHLLKADEERRKIGYENVTNIAFYLYELALNYYKFEEWDKALHYFVAASKYPFYIPWAELSNLHAIGQIYDRKGAWGKAEAIYRQTIIRAAVYKDNAWVGIASGSLGNVFLTKGNNDSALFYHRRNYTMNISDRAPEDAAKSALGMATVFVRSQHLDSALYYIRSGRELARKYIIDTAQQLEYQKNVLIVMIELSKAKQDYKAAFHLSDSLMLTKDILRQKLDVKLLNRAVEKSEAERHQAELKLLESQKSLSRLRYSILIAVLLSVMIIAALLFNRYRVKKLRQMKLAEIEKIETEQKLKQAEELLSAYLNIIRERTLLIENMDVELHRLKDGSNNAPNLHSFAANRERLISSTILTDDDWRQFRILFEQVHPGFLHRLWEKFSDLSPAEMRLLILTRLKLSAREMANMLGISIDAIRKARYRVRKKLNLEEESNLEAIVQQI